MSDTWNHFRFRELLAGHNVGGTGDCGGLSGQIVLYHTLLELLHCTVLNCTYVSALALDYQMFKMPTVVDGCFELDFRVNEHKSYTRRIKVDVA